MKVAFFTLGCKVNQYETDVMMQDFKNKGYEVVDFNDQADIYVINSCSVTNIATRKSRKYLSSANLRGKVTILVGCYAQEIEKGDSLVNADLILGNEEKKDIVNILEEYMNKKGISNVTKKRKLNYNVSDISKINTFNQKNLLNTAINVRESIKIEDGCNNFCSYCIIPYVRGRVRSKSKDDIVKEITSVVAAGAKEVVLVGIEIASYGKDLEDGTSLIDIVEEVSKINGLERIRLGSIEPRILTEQNIIRLSKVEKLCPQFHISVQSLDNDVLKRMNRKYTFEDVSKIVDCIRKYFEDPCFTCDVIVGFPGETFVEYKNTLERLKKLRFYEVHPFKYSKRKWTRAAKMENQVDGNIKNERIQGLLELAKSLKNDFLKEHIGKEKYVLIEEEKDGYLYGFTDNYIKVKIRGDKKLWGCLLKIELDSQEDEMILGNILN